MLHFSLAPNVPVEGLQASTVLTLDTRRYYSGEAVEKEEVEVDVFSPAAGDELFRRRGPLQLYCVAAVEREFMLFVFNSRVAGVIMGVISALVFSLIALILGYTTTTWLGPMQLSVGAALLGCALSNYLYCVRWKPDEKFLRVRQVRVYEALCIAMLAIMCSIAAAAYTAAAVCVARLSATGGQSPEEIRRYCSMQVSAFPFLIVMTGVLLRCCRTIFIAAVATLAVVAHFAFRPLAPDDTTQELALRCTLQIVLCSVGTAASFVFERASRDRFEAYVHLRRNADMYGAHRDAVTRTLGSLLPAAALAQLSSQHSVFESSDACVVSVFQFHQFLLWSSTVMPAMTVRSVNAVFSQFDDAAGTRFAVDKVKTVGDRYLCSCGLRSPCSTVTAAARVARMALWQVSVARRLNSDLDSPPAFQVAMSCGPCFGGFIGTRSLWYEMFGDAYNTATELVRQCPPDKVLITQSCRAALGPAFECQRYHSDQVATQSAESCLMNSERVGGGEERTATSWILIEEAPKSRSDGLNVAGLNVAGSNPRFGQDDGNPNPSKRALSSPLPRPTDVEHGIQRGDDGSNQQLQQRRAEQKQKPIVTQANEGCEAALAEGGAVVVAGLMESDNDCRSTVAGGCCAMPPAPCPQRSAAIAMPIDNGAGAESEHSSQLNVEDGDAALSEHATMLSRQEYLQQCIQQIRCAQRDATAVVSSHHQPSSAARDFGAALAVVPTTDNTSPTSARRKCSSSVRSINSSDHECSRRTSRGADTNDGEVESLVSEAIGAVLLARAASNSSLSTGSSTTSPSSGSRHHNSVRKWRVDGGAGVAEDRGRGVGGECSGNDNAVAVRTDEDLVRLQEAVTRASTASWWDLRYPDPVLEAVCDKHRARLAGPNVMVSTVGMLVYFLCCVGVTVAQDTRPPASGKRVVGLGLLAAGIAGTVARAVANSVRVLPVWEAWSLLVVFGCLISALFLLVECASFATNSVILLEAVVCTLGSIWCSRFNWWTVAGVQMILLAACNAFERTSHALVTVTPLAMGLATGLWVSAAAYVFERDSRHHFATVVVNDATMQLAEYTLYLHRSMLQMLVPAALVDTIAERCVTGRNHAAPGAVLHTIAHMVVLDLRIDSLNSLRLHRLLARPDAALRHVETLFQHVEHSIAAAKKAWPTADIERIHVSGDTWFLGGPLRPPAPQPEEPPMPTHLRFGVGGTKPRPGENVSVVTAALVAAATARRAALGVANRTPQQATGLAATVEAAHAFLDILGSLSASRTMCTAVLADGPGFVSLMGVLRPALDVLGPVTRVAKALMAAAPSGALLMTESVGRMLRDEGVVLPRRSDDLRVLKTQRWRVRAAGQCTVILLSAPQGVMGHEEVSSPAGAGNTCTTDVQPHSVLHASPSPR